VTVPPPTSASCAVTGSVPLAANAEFSGVSGWRKPGAISSTSVAVFVGSLFNCACISISTVSRLSEAGGV